MIWREKRVAPDPPRPDPGGERDLLLHLPRAVPEPPRRPRRRASTQSRASSTRPARRASQAEQALAATRRWRATCRKSSTSTGPPRTQRLTPLIDRSQAPRRASNLVPAAVLVRQGATKRVTDRPSRQAPSAPTKSASPSPSGDVRADAPAHQPARALAAVRDHRRSRCPRATSDKLNLTLHLKTLFRDDAAAAPRGDEPAVMDWMNWKTWTAAAVILLAVFAIYTFAAPDGSDRRPAAAAPPARPRRRPRRRHTRAGPGDLPGRGAGAPRPARSGERQLQERPQSLRVQRAASSAATASPAAARAAARPGQGRRSRLPRQLREHRRIPTSRTSTGTASAPRARRRRRLLRRRRRRFRRSSPGSSSASSAQPQNPIATFTRDGEIVNARVGDTIEGKFILRRIGIESAEISFVGFPPDVTLRVPLGAQ